MDVKVTARHARVSKTMKEYAEEKARRLPRLFDRLRKVEVVLDREGADGASAEMIVSAVRGKVMAVRCSGRSAMEAVDAVTEKMEHRLSKFKGRMEAKRVQSR